MARTHRPPRALLAAVAALVLVAAGLGGWYWWRSRTPPAPSAALTGIVETTSYQVAAATAGRITEVGVVEGARVAEGDVVVRLDDRAAALQVQQADAGVAAAQAAVRQARADKVSAADLDAARARQTQAEAARSIAEVQRDLTTVRAPHAGVVTTVSTNVGQNASPGRTLVTLVDPAQPYVRVYLPEPRLGEVRVGQPVDITSDLDATIRHGTVITIATDPEFSPHDIVTKSQRITLVYEVRVRIDDTSGALKAGLPVDVALR
ncbi:HlyD family secretion protein [Raineyella sp. LH-20]|uniref:HlyD family secretion protein n=1 Tax=Raineyella sp. LH-20 TaxID=3081204 RepID=UPI00295412DC|nr:HlyD family efflux transporter periplasmic adaptor subunit [Raineyella sp. LH-20]WOP18178.1 HlyD family efflux transporter periplasmic adaptor subunit [Raineyella sp. LH-20]